MLSKFAGFFQRNFGFPLDFVPFFSPFLLFSSAILNSNSFHQYSAVELRAKSVELVSRVVRGDLAMQCVFEYFSWSIQGMFTEFEYRVYRIRDRKRQNYRNFFVKPVKARHIYLIFTFLVLNWQTMGVRSLFLPIRTLLFFSWFDFSFSIDSCKNNVSALMGLLVGAKEM